MKVHIIADSNKKAAGIRLENLPKNGMQNIHVNVLEKHKKYITITRDKIVYHTLDGDVVFNVVQNPGRYCSTCNEQLPDFAGNGRPLEKLRADQCKEHVAGHGASAIKLANWPHGYTNRPQTFVCSIEDQRGV